MRNCLVAMFVASMVCLTYAKDPDPRLATMTKVYVQPIDQLEDDGPVAACVVAHLPTALPLTVVDTPEEADAVIKIHARVFGETRRGISAAIGGANSVELGGVDTSVWIGDTRLWRDSGTVAAGNNTKRTAEEDICSLADASINDLGKALKTAREAKK
jgi:hypothetical protein